MLLAAALKALGYDLYCGAARVVAPTPEPANPKQVLAAVTSLGTHHPSCALHHAKGQRSAMQVSVMGYNHQIILVRGPEDSLWRLVDVGFGGKPPTHPIRLQAPSNDTFTGEDDSLVLMAPPFTTYRCNLTGGTDSGNQAFCPCPAR